MCPEQHSAHHQGRELFVLNPDVVKIEIVSEAIFSISVK